MEAEDQGKKGRRKCEGGREGRKEEKERKRKGGREKERNPQQRSPSLGHRNADILPPVHHPWLRPAHRGRLASVTTRIG